MIHDHVLADLADRFEVALEGSAPTGRLRRRWTDWSAVTEVLGGVAAQMVSR